MSPLKVGVFGGSFNPPHQMHLTLLKEAKKKFSLDLIKVIPAYCNPLRPQQGVKALAAHRLLIVKKMFKAQKFVEVDDQEIKRGGVSYSVDTVKTLHKKFKNLFFIMGMDELLLLDQWKDFQTLIKLTHIIVCSRKGLVWKKDNWPQALKLQIKSFQKTSAVLKTGKSVFWLPLKGEDMSSSQIRSRVYRGLSIDKLTPSFVIQWIKKNKLYQTSPVVSIQNKITFCKDILTQKKAQKVQAFHLSDLTRFPFLATLLASGLNTRHTQMMAVALRQELEKWGCSVLATEGMETGRWIILDCGELAVHIFYHYIRQQYALEDLWTKAGAKEC